MGAIFGKSRPRAGEIWQLDRYRIPVSSAWIGLGDLDEAEPFDLWVVACKSLRTGLLDCSRPEPAEPGLDELRQAVAGTARKWRACPERVQVAHPRLAEDLGPLLAAEGVAVELREGDFELHADLAELGRAFQDSGMAGILSGAGVTVAHVAAFAAAAARFAAAAPWRHLSSDDLLRIEAPGLEPEMAHVRVFGPRTGIGLLFHGELGWDANEEEDEELLEEILEAGTWVVHFEKAAGVPAEDRELWERHRLPRIAEGAYPVAFRAGEHGHERPDARRLACVEGVLSALAATTEEEMDRGRWVKEVATAEGRLRLVLSLPDLLAAADRSTQGPRPGTLGTTAERAMADIHRLLRDQRFESVEEANAFLQARLAGGRIVGPKPETPEERAQELAYEARESIGRRQTVLARQALALWPDCADAWAVLAERAELAGDDAAARELHARAVAAGERALGPEVFAGEAGHFWGLFETRPYMRARNGLAGFLWHEGAREEAVAHWLDMLRLNPDDNLGVRHSLEHALLALGRHEELEDLLARYPEKLADWAYARALLTFRQEGDSPRARHQLAHALRVNRHVPKYLLGRAPLPSALADSFHPGGEDEAVGHAILFQDVWAGTPGAFDWLRARSAGTAAAAGRGKRRNKKKGKRRGRRK